MLTKEESTAGSMPGMVVQKWKSGRDEWSARRGRWIVIPPTREDTCHLSQQLGRRKSLGMHPRWRDQELAVQWRPSWEMEIMQDLLRLCEKHILMCWRVFSPVEERVQSGSCFDSSPHKARQDCRSKHLKV